MPNDCVWDCSQFFLVCFNTVCRLQYVFIFLSVLSRNTAFFNYYFCCSVLSDPLFSFFGGGEGLNFFIYLCFGFDFDLDFFHLHILNQKRKRKRSEYRPSACFDGP